MFSVFQPEDDHETEDHIKSIDNAIADSHRLAESFLQSMGSDRKLLRYYRDDFVKWEKGAYKVVSGNEIKHNLRYHIEMEFQSIYKRELAEYKATGRGKVPTKRNTTSQIVTDAFGMMISLIGLSCEFQAPCWIGGDNDDDPKYLLSTNNALVNVKTGAVYPATPNYFTFASTGYDYEENPAIPARWFQFLEEVFPDNPDAIRCLRQMFGYLLTRDAERHKMFVLEGVSRGGKSTIVELIRSMVGQQAYVACELDQFADKFGTQSLIGKNVAGIPESRLDERGESTARIINRLLSLAAADTVTVKRKFKEDIDVKMTVKIVMACNKMPKIRDESGAFVKRVIMLPFTQSFDGKQDYRLKDKLLAELPGILKWAIEGFQDLESQGNFTECEASHRFKEEYQNSVSPTRRFVSECCKLTPEAFTTTDDLYNAYLNWCNENNDKKVLARNSFCESLQQVAPVTPSQRRVPTRDRTRDSVVQTRDSVVQTRDSKAIPKRGYAGISIL